MKDFVQKINEVQVILQRQGLSYNIADICELASNMPAPQFYCNVETALKQYNLYKKGKSRVCSIERRKMYAEIFARYERLVQARKSTGQIVRKGELMNIVLNQSAPSFYYGDKNSALHMYYYAMAHRKKIMK